MQVADYGNPAARKNNFLLRRRIFFEQKPAVVAGSAPSLFNLLPSSGVLF
jgi:hypothetical protein